MNNMPDTLKFNRNNFNNPFAALKHRNFRYYWFGMCISLVGTWMQNIAQPWLAYSLTKSPFLLSLVGALQFAPMLLFTLFAGVLIDRFPKKRLLLITQSAQMVVTFTLATLVQSGQVRYWHILVAATATGVVNSLDMPARQSFVIELVGKADLMNAIALNSSVFNLARTFGPAVAGMVMAYGGIGTCFYINSLSFAAVIIGLLYIKPLTDDHSPVRSNGKLLPEIRGGLVYLFRDALLRRTVIMAGIVCTFAMNYNVLVPVLAKTVLKQQAAGFGFLMSFIGVGSLFGALGVAAMSKSGPRKLILGVLPFVIAGCLILTGYADQYLLVGLGLAFTGFFFVAFSSTANSTVQLNTKDEYRGRVMSIYTLVFSGFTPAGNLYAGWITEHYGPRMGFVVCGATVILLSSLLLVGKNGIKGDRDDGANQSQV
jgi:MFS family permease